MKSFNIGHFGRCRIWTNEPVDAAFNPVEVIEASVAAAKGDRELRSTAIEVFLPRGARAEYGLLGMRYEPMTSPDLTVKVLVSETRGRVYEESLASQVDTVHVGLPAEYARVVLDATSHAASDHMPPGLLVIDRAAHALAGSSPNLFAKLAALLVQLMSEQSAGEELINRAFNTAPGGSRT